MEELRKIFNKQQYKLIILTKYYNHIVKLIKLNGGLNFNKKEYFNYANLYKRS